MSVLGFAERIAGFHGSQCGFCTPGMVVACHTALSIAQSKGEQCTPMQMEKAFDGNLCRCTGYRPILDGCKVRHANAAFLHLSADSCLSTVKEASCGLACNIVKSV